MRSSSGRAITSRSGTSRWASATASPSRACGGRSDQALALSTSIMRVVLDECASVLTGDALEDARFRSQQSIVTQSVHSAMAVPLFDNERVLGLLYADSQSRDVTFRDEE